MAKKAGQKAGRPGRGRRTGQRADSPAPAKTIVASDLMPSTGEPNGDGDGDELQQIEAEAQRLEAAARDKAADRTDKEVAQVFPRGSVRRQTQVRQGMVGAGREAASASPADALEQYPDLIRQIRSPLTPLDLQPGERVFHSKFERHVVQVTTPAPEYDPLHGKRIDKPGHTLIFTPRPELGVGEFRTDNEKDILFLEGGTYRHEGKEYTIPPAMGYGYLIWDAAAKRKAESQVYVRNLKEQLAASTEVVEALRQELSGTEFDILSTLAKQARKDGVGTEFS